MNTRQLTADLKRIAKSDLPQLLVPDNLNEDGCSYHIETQVIEGRLLLIDVVVDHLYSEDDRWADICDSEMRGMEQFLHLSESSLAANAERIAILLNEAWAIAHTEAFQQQEEVLVDETWGNYFNGFRDAVRAAGYAWTDDEIDHRITVCVTCEPKGSLTEEDVFTAYDILTGSLLDPL